MDSNEARRILGVGPTATFAEIKAAYYKQARKLHPDVNVAPTATADMQRLNAAYERLTSQPASDLWSRLAGGDQAKGSVLRDMVISFVDLVGLAFEMDRATRKASRNISVLSPKRNRKKKKRKQTAKETKPTKKKYGSKAKRPKSKRR